MLVYSTPVDLEVPVGVIQSGHVEVMTIRHSEMVYSNATSNAPAACRGRIGRQHSYRTGAGAVRENPEAGVKFCPATSLDRQVKNTCGYFVVMRSFGTRNLLKEVGGIK